MFNQNKSSEQLRAGTFTWSWTTGHGQVIRGVHGARLSTYFTENTVKEMNRFTLKTT